MLNNHFKYKELIFFKQTKRLYCPRTGTMWKAFLHKSSGYYMFWLWGGRQKLNLHRIIGELFIKKPNIKNKRMVVDHINRCRHDNRLDNLRWLTYKQNNNNRRSINWKYGYWYEG